jgi:hypothetical protein
MTDYSKADWVPSPNFWPGHNGLTVTGIVLHGTAGGGAVSWFQNPVSQVSAHYVVEEDGTVTQCVNEADSAWHNGVVTPGSQFLGRPNPNYWTLGIEHTRNMRNDNPMPAAQIEASLALVSDILRRHGPLAVYTHDQFNVGRVCPGPGFPLQRFLALEGHQQPIIWESFTAKAMHIPLGFFQQANSSHHLYDSSAQVGSVIQFDAWTYGESVLDPSTGEPDRRWYHRHNPSGQQGWTPSAWVDGNAPNSSP